jgi:hypothetical protein
MSITMVMWRILPFGREFGIQLIISICALVLAYMLMVSVSEFLVFYSVMVFVFFDN